MNFYDLNEQIQREQLELEGQFLQNVANFGKRLMWGPQAEDGTRPMANWSIGRRMTNALQPPENRVTADQARQQQQLAARQPAAQPQAQSSAQPPAQPGAPDDQTFQNLRQQLPNVGRAIDTIQDPAAKQALYRQYQSLFNLLHKTQAAKKTTPTPTTPTTAAPPAP